MPFKPSVGTSLSLFGSLAAVAVLAGCGSSPTENGHSVRALAGHAGTPAAASWAPWPQALYDAQHSGATSVVGPQTGHVRWTRKLEGDVTPGPVVGPDGTIYAASNGGVLHAVDPATGKDRWTLDEHASYGNDLSTSPAVLPNGLILWPGPNGNLIAVDPDGTVKWRLALGDQPTSPAVLPDGTVAVGTTGGTVAVLRPTATSAGERWRVDLGDSTYGSVVWSEDGRTVYQSVSSGVVALRDGKVAWKATVGQVIEVSAAVAPDGTVVVGTNDPFEYGLDPTDGSVRWKYARKKVTYSSPVVTADGIAYFGDHQNRITGLDATTGKQVFQYQGSEDDFGHRSIGIWTSVAVDGHHDVYVGTRQGLIYGVDRDGKRLWSISTGTTVDSYPALTADGALVIGVTDGRLLAIGDK